MNLVSPAARTRFAYPKKFFATSYHSSGTVFSSAVASLSETGITSRSEEHTSELQSPCNLVCRLLLEKKKTMPHTASSHPGVRGTIQAAVTQRIYSSYNYKRARKSVWALRVDADAFIALERHGASVQH